MQPNYFRKVSPQPAPPLPLEIVENIIQQAWLNPQRVRDRIKLMTTHNLVNHSWLILFTRVWSYDIDVIDFYDRLTPLSNLFPLLSDFPARLCRSLRVCKIGSPQDDASEDFYMQMPDASIAPLRMMSIPVKPVPS